MTGAESLLHTLIASGIRVCFMNPGTSEMHFVSALDHARELRGVLCLFEGVCSGAADGYARMTRTPAATLLHLGPGLANGLSNFHNARKARSPVVSIVGEHSRQHLEHDAPLSADIVAFARTVSSDVCVVRSAAELPTAAAETVVAARRPPGQVATLIVPADLSWSKAPPPAVTLAVPQRRAPDDSRVAEAARLLRSGRRTGLLLSGTALLGQGLELAARIAAGTGAPVYADRNAARLPSGRGRFQPERIPYFPEPAQSLLAGLEHLILVEAKPPVSFFGYPNTRSELAPEGCEMHVLAALDEDGLAALEILADKCGAIALPGASATHAVNDALGAALAEMLPEGAIISDEMVSAGPAVWPHLLNAAPHDHLPVTGGSIGQGLPVAVGAAIACPDRKVVALEADGSGMYTLQSLWTIAREQLDVTTVIFANRRYQILEVEMLRTGADGFGPVAEAMIDISRPDLDWVQLSEGMGVPARRATTADEFRAQFSAAMQTREPHLIEAALPFR